jgi:hypothetical protein
MSQTIRFRGDELDLYGDFNHLLVRELMRDVRFTQKIAEDAAADAWISLFREQPDRADGHWRVWLVRVAEREATRLADQALNEPPSLDAFATSNDLADPRDRTEERLDFDAAMQALRRLTPRMQQAVVLNSQLPRQADVARMMNVSRGRVAELLAQAARRFADDAHAGDERASAAASPRARVLRELQDEPPKWLTAAVGTCPHRSMSNATFILAWRRAALAIHDYRTAHHHASPTDAIGRPPDEPAARRAYRRANEAIVAVEQERMLLDRGSGHTRG